MIDSLPLLVVPADLGANEIREDLRGVITNVDPVETPFFSMSGSVDAGSVHHEWLTDTLGAISTAGSTQGSKLTATNLGRPARVDNWTQILRRDYSVSDTEEAVTHAGIDSAFAYQTMKALRELARNTEASMIRNTRVTEEPLAMDGLATFIQTNNTAFANVSLLQNDFHTLQQTIFDVSGIQPDTCFVSSAHKRAVSTWYTSVTREVGNMGRALGVAITEAITDFGPVQFVIERYTQPVTVTAAEFYLVPMALVNKAWLIPTRAERQARDGDLTPGMVMHQLCLEVLNEGAFGRAQAGLVVSIPT